MADVEGTGEQRKFINYGGPKAIVCDGRCDKAWGINNRPKIEFDVDEPDDYAFLADDELGEAPEDPGTYEGGYGKPWFPAPHEMNKWCARECERSDIVNPREVVDLPDFSKRFYNMPSRHPETK